MFIKIVIIALLAYLIGRYWKEIKDITALVMMFVIGGIFVGGMYIYHKIGTLYMIRKKTKGGSEDGDFSVRGEKEG